MQCLLLQRITKKITGLGLRKNKANQSQFTSVQGSAFSGQRQDEEKGFEKTKPILGKGKSKKVKGKMSINPELLRMGDLKKQSQFSG